MSSRKRHYEQSEEEEEGRISSDEEDGEIDKRSKKSKKSKKHKKEKKRKKRRKRSETPETDKEGAGSTPEIEAGEVVEISEEEMSPTRLKREKSLSPPPIKDSKPLKIQRSPSPEVSSKSQESLSIEETNKLRASLGLAPLKINKPKVEETENDKDKDKEGKLIPNSNVRHKPAENLTHKSATEKMREKLQQRKLKRQQESKLLSVGTLGDDDGGIDDTSKWLQRQKKKEKEKKIAEKRAKMLAEMDDEFGVGNLVEQDKQKSQLYNSQNLAGLTVEHDSGRFQEGKSVILTLKDADVLDNDASDTLVNVNMIDDEKVKKNKENIKKAKSGGYNPYDQEEIDEETGELRRKNMLDKYDEEIDGEKKQSFTIGDSGVFNQDQQREINRAKIRQKLANVETLHTPQLKVASDYYTEEEVVKFKKPKKKKKVKRKMLKADDLLGLENDTEKSENNGGSNKGSIPMDVDEDVKPFIDDEELAKIKVDDEETDLDLQLALQKARKIKQRKRFLDEDRTAKLMEENGLSMIKTEPENESTGAEFINTFADDKNTNFNVITMNETSEFCRNLGAIRSYEASGYTDKVPKEIRDFESELSSSKHRKYSSDSDSDVEVKKEPSAVILDEEPDLKSGIAAALGLARSKGYLEGGEKLVNSGKLKHLEARNYTIEDKANDDRHSRRNYGSSSQSFQEKKDYVPNVKLEYVDDDGRKLNTKEAFRHLSHKFHGKGSGKLKSEKRQKKVQEESLMKNMSSTDTPLNTVEKLRQKQRQAATPYVILTGNKVQATDLKK